MEMHYPKTDEYSDKRDERYGTCLNCNKYNTSYEWCQLCDPQLLTQGWTSGNNALDKIIKSTQLKTTEYDYFYYLQWIPHDHLKDIEEIGEGGSSIICKATWLNGKRYINENNKRCSEDLVVALKEVHNSKNLSKEFLNELENYIEFRESSHIIKVPGLTQNPDTKNYIFVMNYMDGGCLQDYLSTKFKTLKWVDKIEILCDIIDGLKQMHKKGTIHRDFHGGNILKGYSTFISDLGLSVPADQTPTSNDKIIGVLPYIAPDVLRSGGSYTMASDIYSFGVLMSVISTGQRPFSNLAHDTGLAISICEGLRPGFSENTPKLYVDLAYRCMDADPDKRPTADKICEEVDFWHYSLLNNSRNIESEKDKMELIKKMFEEMDGVKFDPSKITATVHPDAVYTSRLLNFPDLPQLENSNEATDVDNCDSTQIHMQISANN